MASRWRLPERCCSALSFLAHKSRFAANENVTGLRLLAVQSKMARVALSMGVREVAALAGVSPDTIARLERGEPLKESTVQMIQRCLEAAGVEFTNGDQPGVRMRHRDDAGKGERAVRAENALLFAMQSHINDAKRTIAFRIARVDPRDANH